MTINETYSLIGTIILFIGLGLSVYFFESAKDIPESSITTMLIGIAILAVPLLSYFVDIIKFIWNKVF